MSIKNEALYLENQLCFRLYAASRKITGVYRALLEDLNITYPQYLVMMVLWEQGCITVKELGQKLYLDSGTLTPLLKRLEQKGFLKRERSIVDERSVHALITTKGEELKAKALLVPEKLQKMAGVEKRDFLELNRMLDSVINQIP